MSYSTAATSSPGNRLIQYRKWCRRFNPSLDVDLGRSNSFGRFQKALPSRPMTEFAIAVRRNIEPKTERSQMRCFAQECDWTFLVAVLQFPIRRTHTAERLDAAFHAFRGTRSLHR